MVDDMLGWMVNNPMVMQWTDTLVKVQFRGPKLYKEKGTLFGE